MKTEPINVNTLSIVLKDVWVSLKVKTARDSYATTLRRSGVSTDDIGEMLGH